MQCLQIILERIPGRARRDALAWNSVPGALVTLPWYADTRTAYPFWLGALGTMGGAIPGTSPRGLFTALVYCQLGAPAHPAAPLYRLIRNMARAKHIHRVSSSFFNTGILKSIRYLHKTNR